MASHKRRAGSLKNVKPEATNKPRQISTYEKHREDNIRAKEELLASLNLIELRDSLIQLQQKSVAVKRLQRTPRPYKPRQSEQPTRRSLRIRIKDRTFEELSETEKNEFSRQEEEKKRLEVKKEWPEQRPSGTLQASDYLESEDVFYPVDDPISKSQEFLDSCLGAVLDNFEAKNKPHSKGSVSPVSAWIATGKPEEIVNQIRNLGLKPENKIKITRDRLYSAAFHPAVTNPAILATGDKRGQVGLCLLETASSGNPTFKPTSYQFRPHSSPVIGLAFPDDDSTSLLYSASYDGPIRVLNLEKKVFDEVYRRKDDDMCKYMAFQSKNVFLVALHSGKLAVVDVRKSRQEEHTLCKSRLRTVDVHPVNANHFITARYDGYVDLWDLRKVREGGQMCSLGHGRAVSSAFFSPSTGNRILTASMDNQITVFQADSPTSYKRYLSLKHNNHVGRWLTNLRPIWHPKSENVFLSGSMQQPRVVEAWNVESVVKKCGGKVRNIQLFTGISTQAQCLLGGLTSVCSVLAVHQEFPAVCGVNSSGYAHVWM